MFQLINISRFNNVLQVLSYDEIVHITFPSLYFAWVSWLQHPCTSAHHEAQWNRTDSIPRVSHIHLRHVRHHHNVYYPLRYGFHHDVLRVRGSCGWDLSSECCHGDDDSLFFSGAFSLLVFQYLYPWSHFRGLVSYHRLTMLRNGVGADAYDCRCGVNAASERGLMTPQTEYAADYFTQLHTDVQFIHTSLNKKINILLLSTSTIHFRSIRLYTNDGQSSSNSNCPIPESLSMSSWILYWSNSASAVWH